MPLRIVFDSPFFLGFEQLRGLMERSNYGGNNGGDNYPPFNIEVINDQEIRLSLAVSGFEPRDLRVEFKAPQLTIGGKKELKQDNLMRDFLHRGIGNRAFVRRFVLNEGMVVKRCVLENGLLNIQLARPKADESVYIIPIEVAV